MEAWMRSRTQLEDIPDHLIQHIQSRLPVVEAVRTSVLSKSWLDAWSTILEEERKHLEEVVDHTLIRYLHHNIPIESMSLMIDMKNHESAIKTCLKKLSLEILVSSDYSLTLPAEILSCRHLNKIRISCPTLLGSQMNPLSTTTSHPVINCVSLRRLQLNNVHVSEEVLNNILSISTLLVKVELSGCTGFRTIKVQNLHRLNQFRIDSGGQNGVALEINDVPNIRLFMFKGHTLPFNMASLGCVTTLRLGGMIMDGAFLHIINSKFPFLESLTLDMTLSTLESFDIKCPSMTRLSLRSWPHNLISVHVYAPKLVFFCFSGKTMPSLLFPTIVLEQIEIELSLIWGSVDNSFFLKMREAFTLSRKCDIQIYDILLSNIDLDLNDLKRSVPFPATNVQRLSLRTLPDEEGLWERSPFFDALFLICHPKHVVNQYLNINNHFCKQMVREVMVKKTRNGHWGDCLKAVEIRRDCDEKWETLTNSWKSFLDGTADEWYFVEFKLYWHTVE